MSAMPITDAYRDRVRSEEIVKHPLREFIGALDHARKLELDRRRLVEALRVACLQIAHLQEISGTDRHGELDALRDGKALLRDLGELE